MWAYGLLATLAAADLGLALHEFVLRPLVSQGDPRGVMRTAVVLAVLRFAVISRRRRLEPTTGLAPPSDRPGPTSTADDLLTTCIDDIVRAADGPGEHLPLALHLGDTTVEVFWSAPPPEPRRPWTARHPGWIWSADNRELAAGASRSASPAMSTFVAAGDTPAGSLWLNVEAFRVIALVGDESAAVEFARTTISELRRRARDHLLDLTVVGAADRDGVGVGIDTDDSDHVVSVMRQRRPTRRVPSRAPCGITKSTVEERRIPLIVSAPAALPVTTRCRLADAARQRCGVTCMVVGEVPGADLRLSCRGHTVGVPFLPGLLVTRRASRVPPDAGPRLDARAVQPKPHSDGDTARHAVAPTRRAAAVEIQVLGSVAVRGSAQTLTAKSMELVVYLACHPEGIHEERIKAALWPTRTPRPQTWLNRVSATRKALGHARDGEPLLPRFDRQLGRLAAGVLTDVDLLVGLVSDAKHQESTDAVDTLTEALDLVRGRPFDVPRGFEWAYTELHVAHAERVVVDAAHHLAELALVAGDWRRALWASDIGLRACPTSELLFQDRMRAYGAAGDRRGVDAALRDLRRSLATTDSSDTPSPDTIELHQRLRARVQSTPPFHARIPAPRVSSPD